MITRSSIHAAVAAAALVLTTTPAWAARITSGTLVMDLDAAAFAALAGGSASPGFELLTLDEHFDQSESDARDRAAILADEVEATPSSLGLEYGVNGASVVNLSGRSTQPSDFTYDPGAIQNTALGGIGLGGVDRWNVNPLAGGGKFVIGDLVLAFDPTRSVGGGSGWYLTNHFDFQIAAYDLSNVVLAYDSGELSLSGDVLISPEFAQSFLIAEDAGADVGNFVFRGVPELGTAGLLALALSCLASLRVNPSIS